MINGAVTVGMNINGKELEFRLATHPTYRMVHGVVIELDIVDAMSRFLQPGDCAIDGGANWGLTSMIMSKFVGPEGHVLAFEPDPDNYEYLIASLELNDAKNVAAVPGALWKEDSEINFCAVPGYGASSSVVVQYDNSAPPILVPSYSLDTFVSLKPKLIKLDCEGSEPDILNGSRQLLAAQRLECMIVEFNFMLMQHLNISEKQIREFMTIFGYDSFILQPGCPMLVDQGSRLNCNVSRRKPGEQMHINLMFARREKVSELWGTVNTVGSGDTLIISPGSFLSPMELQVN